MAAQFDILENEIAAIGRKIEKCSEMVSENTEVKNADLLNRGQKIILLAMRDEPYLANQDIKTKIPKLSSKYNNKDLESSTISAYIRKLLELKFIQADKEKGRKYHITESGKKYINTHPPNQRLTKWKKSIVLVGITMDSCTNRFKRF